MTSVEDLLRNHDVIIRKPVTLRSGEVSEFYVDIKKAFGSPELLHALALQVAKNLDPSTSCLAASGYGGLPLGVAVSQLRNLPLSMVRDSEKNHGKRGLIDGYVPNAKDKVAVLDDVFTSGSSLAQTIANLKPTGAQIMNCHVILARGNTNTFPYPVAYLLHSTKLTRELS